MSEINKLKFKVAFFVIQFICLGLGLSGIGSPYTNYYPIFAVNLL